MYINLYSQYQITSDVQIAHKLAHVHKYYGFTFTCIVLFFFYHCLLLDVVYILVNIDQEQKK